MNIYKEICGLKIYINPIGHPRLTRSYDENHYFYSSHPLVFNMDKISGKKKKKNCIYIH